MSRTSQAYPLRIDELGVPGYPGCIGMTLCPGKVQKDALTGSWNRDLGVDLAAIQSWGATWIITLMEDHELMAVKVAEIGQRIPLGIKHLHLPIPDCGVPDKTWEDRWAQVGPDLRSALAKGEKVLIHCLGGLGRTGTLAARILVEFGTDPEQAILAVRNARKGTIETSIQEAYVRGIKTGAHLARTHTSLPRPYYRITPDRASRFRGCLLGGAVGDALGAPVEFIKRKEILQKFGPMGVRDFTPAYGKVGAVSDDTQMTLFTAEGILRGGLTCKMGGSTLPIGGVYYAYLRWLQTQGEGDPTQDFDGGGWLMSHSELFSRRAPGNTCLQALKFHLHHEGRDQYEPPPNQSKGCGGIMRVAPLGLFASGMGFAREEAFNYGRDAAAITHRHPTGYLAAAAFASIIFDLASGSPLPEALDRAQDLLKPCEHSQETIQALDDARCLAQGASAPELAIKRLGEGWIAEEALAISVFCALRAQNLEDGVVMAVNIDGDSDSTGAITGNLLGAALGVHEIPPRWLSRLELRESIEELSDDLATFQEWPLLEYGQVDPVLARAQEYWISRFPFWRGRGPVT